MLAAVVVAGLVFSGWALRGLVEDSKDLAELKGLQQALESQVKHEAASAQRVEELLQRLRDAQRRHHRELLEVTRRPVYQRDCIDDDGLRILQEVSSGREPAVAAGPVRGAGEARR